MNVHTFMCRAGKMYELCNTYPTLDLARSNATQLQQEAKGIVRTIVLRVGFNLFAVYKARIKGDNRYKKL